MPVLSLPTFLFTVLLEEGGIDSTYVISYIISILLMYVIGDFFMLESIFYIINPRFRSVDLVRSCWICKQDLSSVKLVSLKQS